MILGKQATVAVAATLIHTAASNGCKVSVRVPTGGADVTLGSAAVVAGAGYILAAASGVTIDLPPGDSLYGIVASGTQAISVLVVEF